MIEQMYRQAGKLSLTLLVLILAPFLVGQIIQEAGSGPILGVLALVSTWAYFTRSRGKRQPQTRQITGAERTPVLPHEEER